MHLHSLAHYLSVHTLVYPDAIASQSRLEVSCSLEAMREPEYGYLDDWLNLKAIVGRCSSKP